MRIVKTHAPMTQNLYHKSSKIPPAAPKYASRWPRAAEYFYAWIRLSRIFAPDNGGVSHSSGRVSLFPRPPDPRDGAIV
jgi:hypothetical protein